MMEAAYKLSMDIDGHSGSASKPRRFPPNLSAATIQSRLAPTVEPVTLSSIGGSLIPIEATPAGDTVEADILSLEQEIREIASRIRDRTARVVMLAHEYRAKWNSQT